MLKSMIWARAALSTMAASAACDGCGDDHDDTVAVRVNSAVDFSSYQTFAFATPALSAATSAAIPADVQSDLEVINDAVHNELVDRGLTEVDPSAAPNLVVVSLASTDSEQALTWGCTGGYYWWGYWGWDWDPCAWIEPIAVEYEVGTAFVGLVDPAMQTIVFAGAMQGVLDGDDLEDRIDEDVDEMFESYPEE